MSFGGPILVHQSAIGQTGEEIANRRCDPQRLSGCDHLKQRRLPPRVIARNARQFLKHYGRQEQSIDLSFGKISPKVAGGVTQRLMDEYNGSASMPSAEHLLACDVEV